MAIREVALGGLTREQLLEHALPDGADPALRGEGRRGIHPRQDRRLPAPLHRAGGQRRGRHLRAAPEDYVVSSYREHGHAILKGHGAARRHGRAVRQGDRVQQGQGRLDAHVQRRAPPDRRPGHRRRAARHRHWPRLRHPVSEGEARRRLALRRWRGGRGRVPRVAEPRRALEAAGRLRLREQPVLDGHGRHQGMVGRLAGAARRRLWHALRKAWTAWMCWPCARRCWRPSSARARARVRRWSSPSPIASVATRMADPAYYRTREEEALWRTARDPIALFETQLKEEGVITRRDHRRRTPRRPTRSSRTRRSSPRRAPIPIPTRSMSDVMVDGAARSPGAPRPAARATRPRSRLSMIEGMSESHANDYLPRRAARGDPRGDAARRACLHSGRRYRRATAAPTPSPRASSRSSARSASKIRRWPRRSSSARPSARRSAGCGPSPS